MSRDTNAMIARRVFGYPTRRRFLRWEMQVSRVAIGVVVAVTKEWVPIPDYSGQYPYACEVIREMRKQGWSVEVNDLRGECCMAKNVAGEQCVVRGSAGHFMTDNICDTALGALAIAMEGE